jgi:hypothetical protein
MIVDGNGIADTVAARSLVSRDRRARFVRGGSVAKRSKPADISIFATVKASWGPTLVAKIRFSPGSDALFRDSCLRFCGKG